MSKEKKDPREFEERIRESDRERREFEERLRGKRIDATVAETKDKEKDHKMSKKTPLRAKVAKEGFTDSGLPTPSTVDQTVERITTTRSTAPPTTGKPSITADDLRPPEKRSPGRTNKGRVKFTTMLKPELRQQLETIAQNRAISAADVLEIIVTEYLDALREK